MTDEIGFEAHMSHPYPKAFELSSENSNIIRIANPKVILGLGSLGESAETKAVSQKTHENFLRVAEVLETA